MTNVMKEPTKIGDIEKTSSSRAVMLIAFGLIALAWVLIMAGMFANLWETWEKFKGPMDWGKDFLIVAVIPYLGSVISKAAGSNGNGNGNH